MLRGLTPSIAGNIMSKRPRSSAPSSSSHSSLKSHLSSSAATSPSCTITTTTPTPPTTTVRTTRGQQKEQETKRAKLKGILTTTATTTTTTTSTTSATTTSALVLLPGQLMHSTSASSAAKRPWLARTTFLERLAGRAYCSTDGSSTGWHSCVFVAAGDSKARLVARWTDHEGSRNVGAEGCGFQLGVETLPLDCFDCIFLADFLNALAFDVGAGNYKHPALVRAYTAVKQERAKRLLLLAGAAEGEGGEGGEGGSRKILRLQWDHVHHPGHQTDSSWYTVLNRCADHLAGRGESVDITVPVSLLADIAAQKKDADDVLAPYLPF